MNIKIVSLKDRILLLLKLVNKDISRLTSSHPNSHLQSLLTHVQFFIQKSRVLQKMETNLVG